MACCNMEVAFKKRVYSLENRGRCKRSCVLHSVFGTSRLTLLISKLIHSSRMIVGLFFKLTFR